MKKLCVMLAAALCLVAARSEAQFDVRNFGARGDGSTLDTRAIQQAIDKAEAAGGGVVNIPPGTYKIGTLILRDNIQLNLVAGAELLGSPDYHDYTEVRQRYESRTRDLYARYFMIFAENARNISITGHGLINGNGLENFRQTNPQNLRPYMIRLVHCENVTIRDVRLLEAANWTLHLLGCRDVNIEGILIVNHGQGNRDGLDIDACDRVRVSDSRFATTDDAIVMKATNDTICQNITVTNCILSSKGSAIKTGTESSGGFKNIVVSNCVITDIPKHAGIELMTVDGGVMENILLDNITMENVATPIFIRLGLRVRPWKDGQYVDKTMDAKDIWLNNISVLNAKLPSSIMGLHDKKIKNISVTNYTVRYGHTQDAIPYNKVPFEEFAYPMAIMFKNLPAYGLYCRNVEDLHLENVNVYAVKGEKRAAMAFDRVDRVSLLSVRGDAATPSAPLVHLRHASEFTAAYCASRGDGGTLFEVEKGTCDHLHISGNILGDGQQEVRYVATLPDAKVFEDFDTEIKYAVSQGEKIQGLYAHELNQSPLPVDFKIDKPGYLQLCLLILNDSPVPEKVLVKYQGITQEFLIDWSHWGWAPVSLLKQYDEDQDVHFEIMRADGRGALKISKVYLRYQDVKRTD
jgi:hypothetical protein